MAIITECTLLFYVFYFLREAQQPTDTVVYGIFFCLSHHLCNFPVQKFSSKTYISEMDTKETKPKICRKLQDYTEYKLIKHMLSHGQYK